MVKRAFRYRFFPTAEQADLLVRTFGCVHKVYNMALDERTRAWCVEHRRVTYAETSAMLTKWKQDQELVCLAEVSSVPLQQALRHLQGAFVAFWEKRASYPRFKSKRKSKASAAFTRSAFRWRDGKLWLAKCDAPLAIIWSRPLPQGAQPSTVTVSKDAAGRWHVSLLVDDPTVLPLPRARGEVGLDVGLTALVTFSTGETVANPRHERQDRVRLAKAQRSLARKEPGSANREKARRRVARIHARIADRRRDHLHKLTTRLIRENQVIAVEDLSVPNLVANHRLARAISDAGWGELRRMLEYKCEWYGRGLILVDRWFPSSKTCSACGHRVAAMPLSVREWTCPTCGTLHDRDVNAARNVLTAGLAVAACGADIRPQRKSPGGRSASKQETQRVTAGTPVMRRWEDVNPLW